MNYKVHKKVMKFNSKSTTNNTIEVPKRLMELEKKLIEKLTRSFFNSTTKATLQHGSDGNSMW